MAYFRKLTSRLAELQALLNRDDNWMVLISADPDAIAGAFAFQRLISKRVHSVTIARINEVTRPDNLAMLRYLRIPGRQMGALACSRVSAFRHHRFPAASQPRL